eukprot:jgi/Tetstr1/441548/TSEL_029777.t1
MWIVAIPTARTAMTPHELREVAAGYFFLPSPCLAPVVGCQIILPSTEHNPVIVDLYGDALMNLPAPGDAHLRVHHDAIADAFRDHCVHDLGIAVRREVDDLFQQAVPLGNTVPRDELKDLVPDAELSLPAFNVVTGSYDPRSLKSTLLEFKTMRYGVKYTSVPRATAVDRFERSLLGDIQRGLAARDAAGDNTEPGQKGPLRDIVDMSEYTGMVFGTMGYKPDDGESTLDEIVNEVRILQQLGRHPALTYLKEYFLEADKVYMILELVPGGELLSALVERGSLPEEDARSILSTVLTGIAHLHHCGIAHRDLKLENLLLLDPSDITSVKIADFGLSSRMRRDRGMQTVCGTPMYVSPEALTLIDNDDRTEGYGPECDLWACGIILFILLGGHPPFVETAKDADDGCVRLFRQIQRGQYSFKDPVWELVSDEAKDLVKKFLVVDPKKRITAKEALQHPWFTGKKLASTGVKITLECDTVWMQEGMLKNAAGQPIDAPFPMLNL